MTNPVNGNNVMLYGKNPNGVFYLNGGISQGTIGGNSYAELSSTQNVAASANFTAAYDAVLARFITDVNSPNLTTIIGGTWTFTSYVSITYSLTYSPAFYFVVSKYNGTTFTTIATSASTVLTSTNKTLYTTSLTFPTTALSASDRIAITVYTSNVGARDITFYTQGTNVSRVNTTIPLDIPFACSTNCTFSVNVDQLEVTSITSAWFRQYKNDIATWNVTCDGLVILSNFSYLFMLNKQLAREPIEINFVVDNGEDGLVIINGICNITSIGINAPYKDAATYNVSLQGSGAYGTTGTSINQGGVVIRGGYVYNKEYTAAGGETTITWVDMIGKDCVYVSRGGIDCQAIITSGTPVNEQVKWNSLTGVLTFSRALESGEFVRGLFN